MSPTHSNNFFATCPCGYTSTPLKKEGLHEPATCRECQLLVVAERKAFRYDYEPCSNCGAALYKSDTLGTEWYVIDRPAKIVCPSCKKLGMVLTSLPRTQSDDRYVFPKAGDIIHAMLGRNGRITIPDIHTSSVWSGSKRRLAFQSGR